MDQKKLLIRGGCHCGRVIFEFFTPRQVTVLECNCSICRMTGFKHLIVPHQNFRLISGEEALLEYRFGTGKAAHLFCGHCGIKSFYQPRSHPDAWSVNLVCIDHSQLDEIEYQHFDGENWEQASKELDSGLGH